MRTCLIFFAALLASFCATAQSQEKITEYFDKDWLVTTDPNAAAFYRTIEHSNLPYANGKLIIVRDYYVSGKIQMVAECSSISPSLKYQGKCLKYYEDGKLQSEAYYDNNFNIGRHKSFYPGGHLESEVLYRPAPLKTLYVHQYSEAGDELLSNGRGTIPLKSEKDIDQFIEIRDSVMHAMYEVNRITRDTVYYADKPAVYPGGLTALARDVRATLNYPKSARKARIEGTVHISFIIATTGDITEAEVIKSVSPECDAEALSVLRGLKRWIPGESFGKPAKTRFVLPIKFKL